jgi:O-methyltransferase
LIDPETLEPILKRVLPYTMVERPALVDLARQVQTVLAENVPGDFVECGVWRGGASFLMADLLREVGAADRKVWMLDSFEGVPPPEDIDGPFARALWAKDNAAGSVPPDEVLTAASELGLDSHTELVKGWFDETLPVVRHRIGPIAILRIDCDWYSGVRCCLENLYDQVAAGGFVIIDDYYWFDGCAVAVHEFLGERRLPHRLESSARVCFFRKRRQNRGPGGGRSTWRSRT